MNRVFQPYRPWQREENPLALHTRCHLAGISLTTAALVVGITAGALAIGTTAYSLATASPDQPANVGGGKPGQPTIGDLLTTGNNLAAQNNDTLNAILVTDQANQVTITNAVKDAEYVALGLAVVSLLALAVASHHKKHK